MDAHPYPKWETRLKFDLGFGNEGYFIGEITKMTKIEVCS